MSSGMYGGYAHPNPEHDDQYNRRSQAGLDIYAAVNAVFDATDDREKLNMLDVWGLCWKLLFESGSVTPGEAAVIVEQLQDALQDPADWRPRSMVFRRALGNSREEPQ